MSWAVAGFLATGALLTLLTIGLLLLPLAVVALFFAAPRFSIGELGSRSSASAS